MARKKKGRMSRDSKSWESKNQKRAPRADREPRHDCDSSRATTGREYGGNDVSWYSRNPALLSAAGSIPYPYRPGMGMPYGEMNEYGNVQAWYMADSTTQRFISVPGKYNIPGVCTITWMPTLGKAASSTDPANIVARELYAKVRAAYSGALDVDGPDIMVYLGALDSIFAYIASLKRLYRMLSVWSSENYVLPNDLLAAAYPGHAPIDWDQWRSQKTYLWQCINELVLQTRKFKCPAVMDLFNRHYWLCDNVYTDAPTLRSQFYVFNMDTVLVYSNMPTIDDPDIKASGLQPIHTPWSTVLDTSVPSEFQQEMTVEGVYKFGLALIQAMNVWDDCYTINGYLQRAFQDVPSFGVDEIVADPVLTPIYNEEVLMQIENARPVGSSNMATFAGSYRQNVSANNIVSNDVLNYTGSPGWLECEYLNASNTHPIINVRSDSPTVADTVIATRLCTYGLVNNSAKTVTFEYGTEICVSVGYRVDIATGTVFINVPPVNVVAFGVGPQTREEFFRPFVTDAFDWHPLFMDIATDFKGSDNAAYVSVHGDVRNLTRLEPSVLKELHKVCVLSELNAFSQ